MKKSVTEPKSNTGKVILAGMLLAGSAAFLYGSYASQREGLPPKSPTQTLAQAAGVASGESSRERPYGDPASREERMERMAEELALTPEQQKRFEALRQQAEANPGEGFRTMMQESQAILTPEQQEKARAMREQLGGRMQARMAAREAEARELLSPEDFEVWKRKREEMRGRFGGQSGGPGGFRGPDGPGAGRGPTGEGTR